MIQWYKDNELTIIFDKMPNVNERFITPWDNAETKKDVLKYPYINNKELTVTILDTRDVMEIEYKFSIEKEYTWDGASIPKAFWRVIGANTNNQFLLASLIHDVLCENHEYVNYDRYLSSRIFERLLFVAGVGSAKRWAMFHCVDNFQKVFGKWGQ